MKELIKVDGLRLRLEDYGFSYTKEEILAWLRERGYIHEQTYMPAQKSIEEGLIETMKEWEWTANGSQIVTLTLLFPEKGQDRFIAEIIEDAKRFSRKACD